METVARRDTLADQISQRVVRLRKLEWFIETVSRQPELCTEFNSAQVADDGGQRDRDG